MARISASKDAKDTIGRAASVFYWPLSSVPLAAVLPLAVKTGRYFGTHGHLLSRKAIKTTQNIKSKRFLTVIGEQIVLAISIRASKILENIVGLVDLSSGNHFSCAPFDYHQNSAIVHCITK